MSKSNLAATIAAASVITGYTVGVVAQLVVLPLYGFTVSLAASAEIGMWFTLITTPCVYAVSHLVSHVHAKRNWRLLRPEP